MSITENRNDYLVTDYLTGQYLAGLSLSSMGFQVNIVIDSTKIIGSQSELNLQTGNKLGTQTNINVETIKHLASQVKIIIDNNSAFLGNQANISINGIQKLIAQNVIFTNLAHAQKGSYLLSNYLSNNYLSHEMCASQGFQVNMNLQNTEDMGFQALLNIVSIEDDPIYGMQAQIQIVDVLNFLGMQAEFSTSTKIGMQANISLYNTNNLRILCEFPSRGFSQAVGNNAWGNQAGTGNNWKASSTRVGDFEPYRLNTDIVEEIWRSAQFVKSNITLDCDTERPQGVFLDTFAMLNTNISTSATVTLIGSNTSDFSTIGVSISLIKSSDDRNLYYVAPEFPNKSYRYWRISIDDVSNAESFISIGSIVFGTSQIFSGECFVDEVGLEIKDYTDSVQTEGFTNVKNSRAQKKVLDLEFRLLDYNKGNFKLMRNLFLTAKTVLKCLWIPTPNVDDPEITARFAVFAKLTNIPKENHKNIGVKADYVSFNIQLDEAE